MIRRRASGTLAATVTSKPSVFKTLARVSRTTSSSSTSKTFTGTINPPGAYYEKEERQSGVVFRVCLLDDNLHEKDVLGGSKEKMYSRKPFLLPAIFRLAESASLARRGRRGACGPDFRWSLCVERLRVAAILVG